MSAFEPMKENLVRMYEELPTWGKAIFAGGAVIAIYIPFRYFTTRPRKSPIKEDYEKGKVTNSIDGFFISLLLTLLVKDK